MISRVRLFVTPWTVSCQTPLSMEFSRQEYWNGLPFPPPEDPPDPEIKLESSGAPALAGGFFVTQPKYWAYYDHLLSDIELPIKHIHLFGFRVSPESMYS